MRRPAYFSVLFSLWTGLLVVFASPLRASVPKAGESWMGLYMNGRKMGYTYVRIESTFFRGKKALRIATKSINKIEFLGNTVSQDITTTSYTDSRFTPLYQEFVIHSSGSTLTVKADFRPGKILVTTNSGGGVNRKEVIVPPNARLSGETTLIPLWKGRSVGYKASYYSFNPLTLTLDRSDAVVEAQERVMLAGKTYKAFRVRVTTPLGQVIGWESTDGELLKGDMILGMTIYKEPKAIAQDMKSTAPLFLVEGAQAPVPTVYRPPADFAIATAITTDTPIHNPRSTRSLSLIVSGMENEAFLISDDRQKISPVEGKPGSYRIEITVKPFDPEQAAQLPITQPSLRRFLARAPYLEIEDTPLQRTARTLRGEETNAYRIASRIRAWVHGNMTPDYTIGVPRSCAEIYRRRRGVCRDYATLFAGLARAAGIPTRMVGGIVYGEGRFYYHAWVECWVGTWVPFDATMDTDFVDATHIKFIQGDVTDIYRFTEVVGRLRVTSVTVP